MLVRIADKIPYNFAQIGVRSEQPLTKYYFSTALHLVRARNFNYVQFTRSYRKGWANWHLSLSSSVPVSQLRLHSLTENLTRSTLEA